MYAQVNMSSSEMSMYGLINVTSVQSVKKNESKILWRFLCLNMLEGVMDQWKQVHMFVGKKMILLGASFMLYDYSYIFTLMYFPSKKYKLHCVLPY